MKDNEYKKYKQDEIIEKLNEMGYDRVDRDFNLTRVTKELIKEAIEENKTMDRYKLCTSISYKLEDRHQGEKLEYQLKRMNLETTGEILKAIDTYIYKNYRIYSGGVKNA